MTIRYQFGEAASLAAEQQAAFWGKGQRPDARKQTI
jgi:hypothetical protein